MENDPRNAIETVRKAKSEADTPEQVDAKIRAQLSRAQEMSEDLVRQIFEKVRPIERSYRAVSLFFLNAGTAEDQPEPPAELFILNCDSSAIREGQPSKTLKSAELFLQARNDRFEFRGQVSTLAVPTAVPAAARESLQDMAEKWGVLLLCQIGDERSVDAVKNNLRIGRKYEVLLRPESRDIQPLFTVGSLAVRGPHPFEQGFEAEDGLLVPPTLALAGILARMERERLPVGEVFLFPILGCNTSLPCFALGDLDQFGLEHQLLISVRDERNVHCLYDCRRANGATESILRTFFARRVLRFIRSSIQWQINAVEGHVLTRDFLEVAIENPIEKILRSLQDQGVIGAYQVFVDKGFEKRMQGVLDVQVKLALDELADPVTLDLSFSTFKSDRHRAGPAAFG